MVLKIRNKLTMGKIKEKNIILIGFMGVGKGRTARALASASGRFAIDTDDLIESMLKKKVRHIFAQQGEEYFRQIEQQTADWIAANVKNTIVSTGGGFFKVNNLNSLGKIVYLHSSVEEIIDSILNHPKAKKKIKKRPLLENIEQARILFNQRLDGYRQAADLEICVEKKSNEEIARKIIKKLKL